MKNIYSDEHMFHIENLGNAVNKFSFFVAFSASLTLTNATYNKVKFEDVDNTILYFSQVLNEDSIIFQQTYKNRTCRIDKKSL